VATDGRHILFQEGFQFPWQDSVLLPRTTFFGCKEWPQGEPIQIGATERTVALLSGLWTIHCRRAEGRFPKIDDVIPVYDAAKSLATGRGGRRVPAAHARRVAQRQRDLSAHHAGPRPGRGPSQGGCGAQSLPIFAAKSNCGDQVRSAG